MGQHPFRVFQESENRFLSGLVETDDGAQIYVETAGVGPPILFVHGWTMTSRFWCRQKEALAHTFQVVTMDLRGHGNSSKTFQGHTLTQYTEDVQGVMEALGLEKATLVGWSLAGPLVLEYWRRFRDSRVAALTLVETTPFPFSPEPWNTHALKGYGFEGMHLSFQNLQNNRQAFAEKFIHSMFKEGKASPEDLLWMTKEHMKTLTPTAIAIYSDYIMRDCTTILPTISIPSLVINGNSNHLCFGPKTGEHVSKQIPDARLLILEKSGHLPFYEQPEEFNRAIEKLVIKAG